MWVRAEGGFAPDPAAEWELAKVLRGVEKYFRRLKCENLRGAMKSLKLDSMLAATGELPLGVFRRLLGALWETDPRLLALQNIHTRKYASLMAKKDKLEFDLNDLKRQEQELELSGVGAIIRKLQAHMRNHSIRLFDLFTMIDKSGDGLIDKAELRHALEDIYSPGIPLSKRLASKRHMEAMERQAEDEARHAEQQEVMLARMRKSEESGAALAFAKLEQFMRKYQFSSKYFFDHADKDNSGALDVDELHHVLVQSKCDMTRAQVEKMFLFLDENGDMLMSQDELQAAVNEYRAFKRARKFMNRIKERTSHPEQLLPDRQIMTLLRYMVSAGGEGNHISLKQLQAALDESDTMPMSKLFRQYRRRLNPEIYRELDAHFPDGRAESAPAGGPAGPRSGSRGEEKERSGSSSSAPATARSKDGSLQSQVSFDVAASEVPSGSVAAKSSLRL